MKILITGVDGYIGYPLLLKLSKCDIDVIGVDNLARRTWVSRITGEYEAPTQWGKVFSGDLSDKDFVNEILAIHKPDCIIHLASQPSMPYSQLTWERALYTQLNNLSMNLNLLWGIKENGLKNTRYIITTTTGIPGTHYRNIPESDVINLAGSWYHVSRGFDSANCALASRQFGIQVVEFRTSIVYGLQTEELKEEKESTRFDTDFYFGTALNRFVKQALDGKPLTVYGKGDQRKPFISLEDCCESIARAVAHRFDNKHTILNQVTECVSINELASCVAGCTGAKIEHIPNPRQENEEWDMFFDNNKFLEVLGKPKQLIKEGINEMVNYLKKERGH